MDKRAVKNWDLVRHLKTGGVYQIIATNARIEATLDEVVVYQKMHDPDHGSVWIRPAEEFFDGRFERVEPDLDAFS